MLILWTPDENKDLFKLTKDVPADLKVVRHSNTSALPPTKEGDVVLAMGGEVRDTLESLKLIPKKRTIGALRPPKSIKLPTGGTLLVTYSMAVGAVNYELGVQARIDFNMAVRLATTGSLAPKLGHYRWVPRFSEAIEGIREKYAKTGQPVDVALDLETIGLSPYAEKVWILTIQVAWKKGHADIVYIPSLEYQNKLRAKAGTVESTVLDDVRWLLTTEMVSLRGANLKFDLNWIKVHYGFDCTNFKFDTMIVGSLLDENRGSSLNLHTKWYCPDLGGYDDHLNAKYDKSRMDLIPKDELLPYAAGDADACLRVADTMKKELLSDPPLARFYVKILHPAARAYEHVERTGLLIDVPYYLEFENELEAEIERLEKQAFKIMGGRICAKHKDKLSLTRAAVLKEFMFGPLGLNLKPKMLTGKTGEPSTSMDHLMMFATDPAAKEFIDVVNEWAVARKMLSTYVCKRDEDGNVIGGFLSHMQPDCRFHPTYFFHNSADGEGGTNTGRLSARDPAIQCLKGDTPVLTDKGYLPIQRIVEGYERGESYKVLTHTGKWKPVVGVYRNGVQPVFNVMSESGKVVTSTANHPYLTQRGWIRTDQLRYGDLCYELRSQNEEVHQPDIPLMGGDEEPLHQPNQQGLASVWGEGHHGVSRVDGVQELPRGHGGEARQGVVHRTQGGERPVLQGELCVGLAEAAGQQSQEHQTDHAQRADEDRSRVGIRSGNQSGTIALSTLSGDVDGASLDEGDPWNRDVFQAAHIVSISTAGECETFDLTIEGSHSFVANGVVVHNTVPKHSKWAKKLRKAFIAPPGMLILSNDYSQGELKITACLADEDTMIEAYLKGIDLHAVTAGSIVGMDLDEIMALKETQPDKYDELRQLGKAGNFGLIYGMGAEGFQQYAQFSYRVVLSLEQAHDARDKFFKTYPKLLKWHTKYKNLARQWGYIRSPLGRVRHLPLINSRDRQSASKDERRAVNAPVQSTLSDMSLWATARAHENGWTKEAPVVAMVHDQLISYIPEDNWEFYAKRMKGLMQSLPFNEVGWSPALPFTVDCEVGPNLGELKKQKHI